MIRHGFLVLVLAAGAAAGCGPSGGSASAPATGVCKHQLMDADCPWCHPELIEKLGMCKEHGVPEAQCWICKPSLVAAYKAAGDWCGEHGLPESKCKQCAK
jgi:cobalt-zinc-cadmium efflux system membrane fusion protein